MLVSGIVTVVIGIVFIVIGVLNMKGNIKLLAFPSLQFYQKV